MLVLTRQVTEAIQIGDDIVIEVVSCGGGKVRLGIQAPRSVKVTRSELFERPVPEPVRRAELKTSVARPKQQPLLPYGGTVS